MLRYHLPLLKKKRSKVTATTTSKKGESNILHCKLPLLL